MTPSSPADNGSVDRVERVLLGLLVIVLFVPLALWRAWAFSVLWGWFVAPLGFGSIDIAHAIGLMVLIGAFLRRRSKEPAQGWRQQIKDMLDSAALTAFALLIGWGASAWVPT